MKNMIQNANNQRITTGGRKPSIQYLRALCALVVFFSHYTRAVNDPHIVAFAQSRISFIADGAIAVAIFFTLSGFFYYQMHPLQLDSYIVGIKRKVLHIYPAHILVLLFGLLLCNMHFNWNESSFTKWGNSFWNTSATAYGFLYGASCILHTTATTKINPSAWYLEYEVWLFLIMPLVVGMVNKIGWKFSWTLLLFGTFGLALNLEMYHIVNVVGVCCMGVLARHLTTIYEFSFLKKWKYMLIWLGIGTLLLSHAYWGANNTYMFFRGLGAGMIVIAFWKIEFPNIQVLEALGNLSYEFYVVQHIALLAFRPVFVNPLVYFILTFSTTVLLAYLLNRFVTRKALQTLK